MKIKIMQKDVIGYVFFLVVAAVCLAIGFKVLSNHHAVSGAFGLVIGVTLILATISMVLRKE